jgi:hypothetical protein
MLTRLAHLQDTGYVVATQAPGPQTPYWWQAGGSLVPPERPGPITIRIVMPTPATPAAASTPAATSGGLGPWLQPLVPAPLWTFATTHPWLTGGLVLMSLWFAYRYVAPGRRRG